MNATQLVIDCKIIRKPNIQIMRILINSLFQNVRGDELLNK